MTAVGRRLPAGWRDLGFQLALWLGFGLVYQVARGIADRGTLEAIQNGLLVIDAERGVNALFEMTSSAPSCTRGTGRSKPSTSTYWNSEFTVLGISLLWVYLRRHEHFVTRPQHDLLANVIGLVGYVLDADGAAADVPEHRLHRHARRSQSASTTASASSQLAANPYAAMPSLHAADALIVGFVLAPLVKRRWVEAMLWALWPAWVWFSRDGDRQPLLARRARPASASPSSRSRSSPGRAHRPAAAVSGAATAASYRR